MAPPDLDVALDGEILAGRLVAHDGLPADLRLAGVVAPHVDALELEGLAPVPRRHHAEAQRAVALRTEYEVRRAADAQQPPEHGLGIRAPRDRAPPPVGGDLAHLQGQGAVGR